MLCSKLYSEHAFSNDVCHRRRYVLSHCGGNVNIFRLTQFSPKHWFWRTLTVYAALLYLIELVCQYLQKIIGRNAWSLYVPCTASVLAGSLWVEPVERPEGLQLSVTAVSAQQHKAVIQNSTPICNLETTNSSNPARRPIVFQDVDHLDLVGPSLQAWAAPHIYWLNCERYSPWMVAYLSCLK